MFGLKERPYPAHVLISFWCDSDNKNFDSIILYTRQAAHKQEIRPSLIKLRFIYSLR